MPAHERELAHDLVVGAAARRDRAPPRRDCTFSARSRIDAALLAESPAARSVSTGEREHRSRGRRAVEQPLRGVRGWCGPPRPRAAGSRSPAPARRSACGSGGPAAGRRDRGRRRWERTRGSCRASAALPSITIAPGHGSRPIGAPTLLPLTPWRPPARAASLDRPTPPVISPRVPPSRWLLRARRRARDRAGRLWWRRGDADAGHEAGRDIGAGQHDRAARCLVHRHRQAHGHDAAGVRLARRPRTARAASTTRGSYDPTVPTSTVPQVFLVEQQRNDGWVQVLLPVRPNGSTGWVKASDVDDHVEPVPHPGRARRAHHHGDQREQRRATPGRWRWVPPIRRSRTSASRRPRRPASTTSASCSRPPTRTPCTGRTRTGCRATPTASTSSTGSDAEIGIHGNNDPSVLGTQRHPRLHPHGQRRHHDAVEATPPRDPGRHRRLSRRVSCHRIERGTPMGVNR